MKVYEKMYKRNEKLTNKMNDTLDMINIKCIQITRGKESHTSMDILFMQELVNILKESGFV